MVVIVTSKPIGPGPGNYKLPPTVGYRDHDPSKLRYPMWSMAPRFVRAEIFKAPGPQYKIDRFTKEGAFTTVAWSLGSRFPDRKVTRTPGPGAHAPERCPPMNVARAPQYTMAARLGFQLKRVGPAPNAYNVKLPSGAPAYSMAARLGLGYRPVMVPGPSVYFQRDQNAYKTAAPKFSLGARFPGRNVTKTPGPAAYANLYNFKKALPAFSFGVKHSDWAPPMVVREDQMDCI